MLTILIEITGHQKLTFQFDEPTAADVRAVKKFILDRDLATDQVDPAVTASINDIGGLTKQTREISGALKGALSDNK